MSVESLLSNKYKIGSYYSPSFRDLQRAAAFLAAKVESAEDRNVELSAEVEILADKERTASQSAAALSQNLNTQLQASRDAEARSAQESTRAHKSEVVLARLGERLGLAEEDLRVAREREDRLLDELREAREGVAAANIEVANLRAENAQVHTELRLGAAEREELCAHLLATQSQLGTARSELAAESEELRAMRAEAATLRAECADATRALQAAYTTNDELKAMARWARVRVRVGCEPPNEQASSSPVLLCPATPLALSPLALLPASPPPLHVPHAPRGHWDGEERRMFSLCLLPLKPNLTLTLRRSDLRDETSRMAQRERVASADAVNEAEARRSAERAAFALREKMRLAKEESSTLQRRLGECSVLGAQCSALSARRSVLGAPKLSGQFSVLSSQFSGLRSQASGLRSQVSVLSTQCSVLSKGGELGPTEMPQCAAQLLPSASLHPSNGLLPTLTLNLTLTLTLDPTLDPTLSTVSTVSTLNPEA